MSWPILLKILSAIFSPSCNNIIFKISSLFQTLRKMSGNVYNVHHGLFLPIYLSVVLHGCVKLQISLLRSPHILLRLYAEISIVPNNLGNICLTLQRFKSSPLGSNDWTVNAFAWFTSNICRNSHRQNHRSPKLPRLTFLLKRNLCLFFFIGFIYLLLFARFLFYFFSFMSSHVFLINCCRRYLFCETVSECTSTNYPYKWQCKIWKYFWWTIWHCHC